MSRFYSRRERSAGRKSPRRSGGFSAEKRRHRRGRTLASRRLFRGGRGQCRRRRLVGLAEEVGQGLALLAPRLVLRVLVPLRFVPLRFVALRFVLLRLVPRRALLL